MTSGLLRFAKAKASVLIKNPYINGLRGVPLPCLTGDEAQTAIARTLATPGRLVARVGWTEGTTVAHFLRRRLDRAGGGIDYPAQLKLEMKTHSGVFPPETAMLDRVCRDYLADIALIDLYAAWTPADRWLVPPRVPIIRLFDLDPFFGRERWSLVLAGKQVTVVSPFAATIVSQYRHREQLFARPTLPDFELSTVAAPQTHVDQDIAGQDWYANLARMDEAVAALASDILIVGAGAYSLPLAAGHKRRGKSAIVLGGVTQLLFGIYGSRWLNDPQYRALINEHWRRPPESERPQGFAKLEISGGAYW